MADSGQIFCPKISNTSYDIPQQKLHCDFLGCLIWCSEQYWVGHKIFGFGRLSVFPNWTWLVFGHKKKSVLFWSLEKTFGPILVIKKFNLLQFIRTWLSFEMIKNMIIFTISKLRLLNRQNNYKKVHFFAFEFCSFGLFKS